VGHARLLRALRALVNVTLVRGTQNRHA
jgi:hypothetical protein